MTGTTLYNASTNLSSIIFYIQLIIALDAASYQVI